METIDATIVLVDVGLEVSKMEEAGCNSAAAARTDLQWLVWLSLV
jgi:hypothetical protein